MPMSGFEHTPTLAAYSTAVRQFMQEHGIPGGVLAVMKKDKVVVNRADSAGRTRASRGRCRPTPSCVSAGRR